MITVITANQDTIDELDLKHLRAFSSMGHKFLVSEYPENRKGMSDLAFASSKYGSYWILKPEEAEMIKGTIEYDKDFNWEDPEAIYCDECGGML